MTARKKAPAPKLEDGRFYEIGYLLSPALAEDALEETVAKLLTTPITEAGGEIEEQEAATLITLAYPIRKTVDHKTSVFQTAFFGSTHFTVEPGALVTLTNQYRSRPEILRFLLVERPRAVVVPAAAPSAGHRNGEPVTTPASATAPATLDEAALDREIDHLLSPAS